MSAILRDRMLRFLRSDPAERTYKVIDMIFTRHGVDVVYAHDDPIFKKRIRHFNNELEIRMADTLVAPRAISYEPQTQNRRVTLKW